MSERQWCGMWWKKKGQQGELGRKRGNKGEEKLRSWSQRPQLRWRPRGLGSMYLYLVKLEIGTLLICVLCHTKMLLTEVWFPLTSKRFLLFPLCQHDEADICTSVFTVRSLLASNLLSCSYCSLLVSLLSFLFMCLAHFTHGLFLFLLLVTRLCTRTSVSDTLASSFGVCLVVIFRRL